jgi:hypothetical protein
MAEQKPEAVRVDWRQSVSWVAMFRGFRIALDAKKLLLGFVGLVFTWAVFELLCVAWSGLGGTPPKADAPKTAAEQVVRICTALPAGNLAEIKEGGRALEALAKSELLRVDTTGAVRGPKGFTIVFGLLCVAIWSWFGGAIARMAAVQFGRDERISLTEALTFTCRKYLSLFFAPLIPFLAIVLVSIFTGVVGLLVLVPWVGEWFAAVLWVLPLIVGFVLALIALGGVFGMPLMHPTIGVEGSDAFDAISRSFSYVYSRPWRSFFYTVVSAVYGVIVFTFMFLFAGLLLYFSRYCVGFVGQIVGLDVAGKIQNMWPPYDSVFTWGAPGGDPWGSANLTGSERAAAWVLGLWVWVVLGLVWGFAVSYVYSGLTIIYFLLRKNVDNTEFDEVYLEEEEEEPLEEFGATPESTESAATEGGASAPAEGGAATPPAEPPKPAEGGETGSGAT